MDSTLMAAGIGVIGTVIGAALQAFGTHLIERIGAGRRTIASLKGKWDASWYVQSNGSLLLYAADVVEITFHRDTRIGGRGLGSLCDYKIEGRVNSHAIITFSYDSGSTSYAMVGNGVLRADPAVEVLEGRWLGYVKEGELVSGPVIWRNQKVTERPAHTIYHASTSRQTPTSGQFR